MQEGIIKIQRKMEKINKRVKIFGIIVLALFFLNLFSIILTIAQDTPPGMPAGFGQDPSEVIQKAKNNTQTSWEYLGKEWQAMLLKNKVISKIDGFLQKISFVFFALFGMPYSLSITLLAVILLWFWFFFEFGKIFRDFSAFSEKIAWIFSFALVVIMAQTQMLKQIAEWLGWLIFSKKNMIWNIAISLIIIFVFILIYILTKKFGGKFREDNEKKEKEQEKFDRQILHKTTEGIIEGTTKD